MERIIRFIDSFGDRQILFITFLISLLSRLVVILLLGQEQNLYEYGSIAQNLVTGNGFSFDAFPPATPVQETCVMPPFYPYLLAVSYFLFGVNTIAIAAIQIVQSLVGAATVYPLYYLAKDTYSKRTAVLSVLIFAIYPDFLHWSYLIQQLTFTTFSVVSIVYLFRIYNNNPTHRKALALGLGSELGLLVDPVIVSVVGLLFMWILFLLVKWRFEHDHSSIRDVKLKATGLILAIVVCGIVIAPWEMRCLSVYDGNFVFIKASGFNLWRGNNQNYTDTGIPPWTTTDMLAEINMTKEGDIDSAFGQIASTYMLTHMPETLMNSVRKFIDFWWFPKIFPEESPLPRQILYAPLLLLALVAIYIDRRRIVQLASFLLPLIAFSILYSLVFILAHHRIPIQPILFVLSARGLDHSITSLYRRNEA
ncbi:MAG: glycosyltransferase family 39 protein [Candidatus Thorarchaeota archaeon]|nr:glycosyltransferase family 39 protein [Candidatus Thorarchaeota archaeon]